MVRSIPQARINSEARKYAVYGIKLLDKGHYDNASIEFNKGLSLDVTNSRLHFLNGLTYHLRSQKEDVSLRPLAQQGYELAIQFDPTNWVARYYLGKLKLDKRDYWGAREQLAEAVMLHPNEADLLYTLTVAAYYCRDLEMAAGALDRIRQIEPDNIKAMEASSIVMASLNEPAQANAFFDQYKKSGKNESRVRYLDQRIKDWKRFYTQNDNRMASLELPPLNLQLNTVLAAETSKNANAEPAASWETAQAATFGAQSDTTSEDTDTDTDTGPTTSEGEDADSEEEDEGANQSTNGVDQTKMVIVDVVIIRSEEDHTTIKGVNILNGLTLQFGSTAADTAAAVFADTKSLTVADSSTRTLTRVLNIPAITYSLNIANANSKRNEILARPTLIAMNGEESTFFSGQNIVGVLVGGGDAESGSTVQISQDIGVNLAVKPTFRPDGKIVLKAKAERTFLATPNTTSITFATRIDTSKTTVLANVVMNYGETLILSGLSEKETERIRDGVPFLQDVPVVQYLFSSNTTRDFQKSVLILLTPRNPNYVYREGQVSENGTPLPKDEKVLNELRSRYADWFKPYPNWASIFHHMQNNKLYREFRTGDVELERWESLMARSERWGQILDFLFY